MIRLTENIEIEETEITFTAIRAQGAGGQHVNKASTAVHLRFCIRSSSLPDYHKSRLLRMKDRRITKEGEVVIKSQSHRSQEKNRTEAISRLAELVKEAGRQVRKRKPTRPTKAAGRRRLESKTKRGLTKKLRQKVDY